MTGIEKLLNRKRNSIKYFTHDVLLNYMLKQGHTEGSEGKVCVNLCMFFFYFSFKILLQKLKLSFAAAVGGYCCCWLIMLIASIVNTLSRVSLFNVI